MDFSYQILHGIECDILRNKYFVISYYFPNLVVNHTPKKSNHSSSLKTETFHLLHHWSSTIYNQHHHTKLSLLKPLYFFVPPLYLATRASSQQSQNIPHYTSLVASSASTCISLINAS